jgi:prepilin-type N-terminal cleavage/methylation domain-containing protein
MLLKHRQSNKTPPLSKNNKGVTLVELIAVIAVLGVVIAAVTGFVITGAKMSAHVNGVATESIKTQTVVDFINQKFWEAQSISMDATAKNIEQSNGYYKLITIDGAALSTYEKDGINYVGYRFGVESAEPIYLCPGEIYFEIKSDGSTDRVTDRVTVAYHLNGIEHVVSVRIKTKIAFE